MQNVPLSRTLNSDHFGIFSPCRNAEGDKPSWKGPTWSCLCSEALPALDTPFNNEEFVLPKSILSELCVEYCRWIPLVQEPGRHNTTNLRPLGHRDRVHNCCPKPMMLQTLRSWTLKGKPGSHIPKMVLFASQSVINRLKQIDLANCHRSFETAMS